MRIVFMGTPEFAVPVLEAVICRGHEVGYVITQPDKARNRGNKIQSTPVKKAAEEKNIKVLQPEKIRNNSEVIEILKEYEPDIIVVVAYGQLIPEVILDIPKYGCVNIHASLLPKLRGASPIQHAILQGEEKTGVTIMQMSQGIDTGDMLAKAETLIGKKNSEQLSRELADIGAKLLTEVLSKLQHGTIKGEVQDHSAATYAGLISKEDGRIDFAKQPQEIERQIRAFDPWPGAFCMYEDQPMKIWKALCTGERADAENGTVMAVSGEGIDICCGGMILRALELQLPGKKRIDVGSFLRGNKIEKNTVLR